MFTYRLFSNHGLPRSVSSLPCNC